jgi:hypothetical protein
MEGFNMNILFVVIAAAFIGTFLLDKFCDKEIEVCCDEERLLNEYNLYEHNTCSSLINI